PKRYPPRPCSTGVRTTPRKSRVSKTPPRTAAVDAAAAETTNQRPVGIAKARAATPLVHTRRRRPPSVPPTRSVHPNATPRAEIARVRASSALSPPHDLTRHDGLARHRHPARILAGAESVHA